MKDEITIKINLEKLSKDTSKINDLIRNFVFDLRKYCEVIDYSQIDIKFGEEVKQ
jgi:hypothetical protein